MFDAEFAAFAAALIFRRLLPPLLLIYFSAISPHAVTLFLL